MLHGKSSVAYMVEGLLALRNCSVSSAFLAVWFPPLDSCEAELIPHLKRGILRPKAVTGLVS
jgi:hypothetical protein